MKTVTNVNSYVAWAEFQGSRSANICYDIKLILFL